VDDHDVSRWFGEYLDAFAACERGERDAASLLAYYGIPLLLALDDHVADPEPGAEHPDTGMRMAGRAVSRNVRWRS
jgi:hypothetical protein